MMPLASVGVLQLNVSGVIQFHYTVGVTGSWLSFIFIILQ